MSGQRQATSNVVSSFIKTKFINTKTSYNPGDIIDDMQHRFGINLSYHKAWRSKHKAVDEVRGNPNDSYEYIHQYLEKGDWLPVSRKTTIAYQPQLEIEC
ncbi:MuDRA transposase-like [Striga asiatica]|uniref:MuDRA transposase-like n=1 Tax=Striga asiatica TaxID=4170 RepID=A0A5A7QCL7_STRAF|nr:MuDRA transposase-like [Striga asiatica]